MSDMIKATKVEAKIIKGLAKIAIAPITIKADGTYSYGQLEMFAGAREFSAEPQGENYVLPADSTTYYAEEINNGYTGKLTMVRLVDKFKKDILGMEEDATDKMLIEYANKEKPTPKFGLAAFFLTDREKLVCIFYDCQVSKRPTIGAKTKETSIDPQFEEVELLISPRPYDSMVMAQTTTQTPDNIYTSLNTKIWEKGVLNL